MVRYILFRYAPQNTHHERIRLNHIIHRTFSILELTLIMFLNVIICFILLFLPLSAAKSSAPQKDGTSAIKNNLQKESSDNLKKTSSPETNVPIKPEKADQEASQSIIKTEIVSGRHEIPIGSTLPLKGEVAILGKQIFNGMSLFFNKFKQEQQAASFFYDLDVLDDNADIMKIRTNIQTLQKKSPLFLSLLGTETLDCFLQENKSSCALFPFDGTSKYRSSTYKNIVFFRASHLSEIQALIDYSVKTLNKNKIAVLYEASDWGEDVLTSVKKVLETYHLKTIAQASYQQDTINVSPAANAIVSQAPDAIVCIAQARPAYHFIRQIINKGLYKTIFLGLSNLVSIQKTLKNSRGIQLITSAVVPDPIRSSFKIAQEYRTDMKKYTPNQQLSPFSFEGYINAALLTECTKLVKFPLTTEKILQSIEQLKNVKFKGLPLKFNQTTQSLSDQVWLNTGEEKEWKLYMAPSGNTQTHKVSL